MSQNKNILNEIDKLKGYKHFDVRSEWQDFLSIADHDAKESKGSKQESVSDGSSMGFRLWPAIAIAASLLLLFGAYHTFWNQDAPQIDIVEEPIEIEEPKEEIAAKVEEPIIEGPQEEVIAEVPVKEETTYPIIDGNVVTLEDLTKITLVGEPDISYPTTFKGQPERVVEIISGEATFDVAEHEIPFKVIIGDAGIRVLGTVFKTIASPGKSIVENIAGRVQFYEIADESNGIILEVGDKIEFDGESFANLNEEPIAEEASITLNKSDYPVGSVLNYLKSNRAEFFKKGKKLKVNDSDILSIDIDSNLPLEVLLQQFVEAYPQLEYIKGNCEGCLILQNKE